MSNLFDEVRNDDDEHKNQALFKEAPIQKKAIEYYRGCLMGGAIGDAMGAGVVNLSLTKIKEKYGE